jgi:glycosyltransferase involved in cell wall biosynthesis
MRIAVLTTSYPRGPDDVAGVFVRDAVEALRGRGVEVDVVSPASFRHFGIAYGDGIVGNLRRSPWKGALLPLFLVSFACAARRVSRGADLVHAHWLPSALPALTTGRPYVVQLWGSDVALARKAPWAFRWLLRRAQLVVCPSRALADEALALGAREVRVIPAGVRLPGAISEPDGMRRVIVGDGPLRDRVPDAVGFVSPRELGSFYARAAVVACPSRREGFGVVAREAMAHGRPVVATAVGGLLDAVEEGVTGLLVPPRNPGALRDALGRLLADRELRLRLGAAARRRAQERFSWEAASHATIEAYRWATGPTSADTSGKRSAGV